MLTRLTNNTFRYPSTFMRAFTSLNEAVLVRDFIKDAMFNKDNGYNKNKKVGILEKPIEFKSLFGRWDFNKTLKSLYSKEGVHYMNAVELFTPTFSECIADHIVKNHKLGTPLNLFEVSNGSSTNLRAILKYIRTKVPNVYKSTRFYVLTYDPFYPAFEVPEEFKDRVTFQSLNDKERIHSLCDSAYVIMNDCFSGIPHDKVSIPYGTKGDDLNQFQQAVIVNRNNNSFDELYLPVQDALIKQYLSILKKNNYSLFELAQHQRETIDAYNKKSFISNSRNEKLKRFIPTEAFIPTVLLDVFQRIHLASKSCHFVAYDFDYLPPCAEGNMNSPINCINGPIVCNYDKDGKCKDEDSYLKNKFRNDIFFATDFVTLGVLIKDLFGYDTKIMKLNSFMEEYRYHGVTKTMLGWNPLLKDFKNLSFILS